MQIYIKIAIIFRQIAALCKCLLCTVQGLGILRKPYYFKFYTVQNRTVQGPTTAIMYKLGITFVFILYNADIRMWTILLKKEESGGR